MTQYYSWAKAEDSTLLAEEDDICHDAGVCSGSPCFPWQKQFCQLSQLLLLPSLCSILPDIASSLLSECLCFSRGIYYRALVAVHRHLVKRKMVLSLSCQETAVWVSEVQKLRSCKRLTSDFRNNLSLVSCCSYAFPVAYLCKSISSSEFTEAKLQSREYCFGLQRH